MFGLSSDLFVANQQMGLNVYLSEKVNRWYTFLLALPEKTAYT